MFVDDNPTKVLLFITRREVRLRFSFQNMACRLLFIVKLKKYMCHHNYRMNYKETKISKLFYMCDQK